MKISKIWTIIRSRLKSKKNMPDWYYERLKVCEKCPHNSKNKDSLSLKQKILYLLNSLKPYCSICFCQLESKCSEESESCSADSVGEEKKWNERI